MLHSIQEYDERISQLCALTENAGNERDSITDAISSLIKDEYCAVIEKQNEVNDLYSEGVITTEEYNEYMTCLKEKCEELEDIAVPYMTEAANAINLALIKTEIKEIESHEGKRIVSSKKLNLAGKSWMRRRLAMLVKIHPEIIPVKELKKRKVTEKIKNKLDPNNEFKTIFEYVNKSGKTIFYSFKDGNGGTKYTISLVNKKSNFEIAYYSLYNSFLIFDDPTSCAAKKFMNEILAEWKKLEKEMSKTIKESVLKTAEENHGSIEYCFEMVDMAMEEGVLPRNIGNQYKAYVEKTYEKSTLLQSLERNW